MNIEIKDWLYLLGLVVTLGTFAWKLDSDRKHARFRETIGYLEKRDKDVAETWRRIRSAIDSDAAHSVSLDQDLHAFFAQLELVALLIKKGAFDEEIVYNLWWHYFYKSRQVGVIENWIKEARTPDQSVYEHYMAIYEKWNIRIAKEQTRSFLA
jgi:Domain of unknown function (DUF4760)